MLGDGSGVLAFVTLKPDTARRNTLLHFPATSVPQLCCPPITKLDRLARSTPDLYRIVSQLTERGIAFKVLDDPSIDTTSRTGKLIMGILALIAEFENDIRRERQQDGINKAKAEGVRFGPKPLLTAEVVKKIKELRKDGLTVPEIMRRMKLSKASIYRALA